jgi:hypothetical protein
MIGIRKLAGDIRGVELGRHLASLRDRGTSRVCWRDAVADRKKRGRQLHQGGFGNHLDHMHRSQGLALYFSSSCHLSLLAGGAHGMPDVIREVKDTYGRGRRLAGCVDCYRAMRCRHGVRFHGRLSSNPSVKLRAWVYRCAARRLLEGLSTMDWVGLRCGRRRGRMGERA